jgi:hypothetical protein
VAAEEATEGVATEVARAAGAASANEEDAAAEADSAEEEVDSAAWEG